MNDVAKGFSKALVFIIVVVCCLFFIERNSLENKGIGDVNIENILEDERKEYTETKESYIEDAKKLYEKYNFKKVGLRKKYYNGINNAVIMTKDLKNF